MDIYMRNNVHNNNNNNTAVWCYVVVHLLSRIIYTYNTHVHQEAKIY